MPKKKTKKGKAKDHSKWVKDREAKSAAESEMQVETPMSELKDFEFAVMSHDASDDDAGPMEIDRTMNDVRLKIKMPIEKKSGKQRRAKKHAQTDKYNERIAMKLEKKANSLSKKQRMLK